MTPARALPSAASADASGPVIPSLSMEALLARRAAAVEALTRIAAAVGDYQAIGAAMWATDSEGPAYRSAPYRFREPIELRPSGSGDYLTEPARWLEGATKSVDAALWDYLLDRSGLRTFMDAKARAAWAEQIEKRETPPITPENVRATFQDLHGRRGEFFERGVLGVFRSLSWDFATNSPRRFGKRIILRHLMSECGGPRSTDGLDDLVRVLSVLDGKPEPDHRQGMERRLWDLRHARGTEVVDGYLKVRVFKNGNGHVTFLRPDLVDEMNLVLARHYPGALPPRERE